MFLTATVPTAIAATICNTSVCEAVDGPSQV